MRKESRVFFLMASFLHWTKTEGGCSGTLVSISGENSLLPSGAGFQLICEFTCLRPQHVAQMWRDNGLEGTKNRVALINITSILPSAILVLSISSATQADSGYYSCMTQPPDTISPQVLIQITDNLTSPDTPQCDSTQQHSRAAGLQGQIWYWILLGKTAILLLSLASTAAKYKRR